MLTQMFFSKRNQKFIPLNHITLYIVLIFWKITDDLLKQLSFISRLDNFYIRMQLDNYIHISCDSKIGVENRQQINSNKKCQNLDKILCSFLHFVVVKNMSKMATSLRGGSFSCMFLR